MECLAVPKLPNGLGWLYEIKLDGYRAIAVKSGGKLNLFSRRRNSFNRQYALVVECLADLPDDTVIDGEIVALNESGRPDFNLLQHYRAEASRIHYFVFDLLVYNNRDLTRLPLIERHEVMKCVLKLMSPRIRIADYFEASAGDMLTAARAQGLEGVVAKRKDSRYEAGKRSGAWANVSIEQRARTCDRRLHSGRTRGGCYRCWVLPGRRSDLCRASSERLCPSFAAAGIREAQALNHLKMSVRQSSGET